MIICMLIHYLSNAIYNFSVDALVIIHQAKDNLASLATGFVDEYFKVTMHLFTVLKDKLRTVQEVIVSHLINLDDVVGELLKKLEHGIFQFKDFVNYYLEKYEELVKRYFGGSNDAFYQFILKVKTDISMFKEEFRRYMKNFLVVSEVLEVYTSFKSWLEYINFKEHVNETVLKIQR